jgi:predicted DNA-binding transcriptional regulator AlpA
MRDRLAETAARYVRTHEAARVLGISPRTLEKYRCHGNGPTFRKLGGRVVYAIDDIEAWADQAACRSTSDPRYVEVRAAGRPNAAGSASNAARLPR